MDTSDILTLTFLVILILILAGLFYYLIITIRSIRVKEKDLEISLKSFIDDGSMGSGDGGNSEDGGDGGDGGGSRVNGDSDINERIILKERIMKNDPSLILKGQRSQKDKNRKRFRRYSNKN